MAPVIREKICQRRFGMRFFPCSRKRGRFTCISAKGSGRRIKRAGKSGKVHHSRLLLTGADGSYSGIDSLLVDSR